MKEKHQKKGFWTAEEDQILMDYIRVHGKGRWNRIAKSTGLNRCGKSCRLRWMNYLSPNVKRGNFTEQEEDLIIRLHNLLGNRWSLIAGRVPGRTDNQVKNYWNTHLSKKLGIKRVKNNAGGPSAVGESSKIPEDPTVKNTSCDGNGEASGPQMKAYDPCEPFMNGCPTSPYWACDDGSLDVISPSLMELLNGYPPDVAYHEFQPYIWGYTNF